MSEKEPIIKFSPFEALLIGEKNKILKRQPMKNTIFVTRLGQHSRTINLRDLFGLESSKKTETNDVIFKLPQRVCDFLKHRKLQNKACRHTKNKKKEILCYEFEGHKMVTKNNEALIPKGKNINVNSNKVKLKKKFKSKSNVNDKATKKFPNPTRKRHYFQSRCKSVSVRNQNRIKNHNGNKHLLRGKDGKFICKKDYEKLNSKKISSKQKYLSNYVCHLYLKKSDKNFDNAQSKKIENVESEMPYSLRTVLELSNLQIDIIEHETTLNKISQCWEIFFCKNFYFPKCPETLESIDFEKDNNLIDIIYETFPKNVKFQNEDHICDFSDVLLNSDILKPEKNVKMYEKKKIGFIKDEQISEILDRRFPLIKLKRINEIMPDHHSVKIKKSVYGTKIDEPYTKKSHLITGKSFGSFFFRSAEGKDIFIGSLIKPFLQNSWFGSLPES